MAQAADPAAVGPQLAYSQEEPDHYDMPADSIEEFIPEQEDEAPYTAVIAPPPPRTLLMGCALAFVVMAFATLAVTVAITIRPAADVQAQPAPTVQSDTVPGRYLPPVPHEPDPEALPIAVVSPPPAAPAEPSVPTNRGPVTNNVPSAPAPQAPPPGQSPAPEMPVVPIPPVIILPPLNPFPTPTTTVTTPTTTSTTTTTTSTTTPTTTTTNADDDHVVANHHVVGAHDNSDVAVDRAGDAEGRAAGDAGARVHTGARVHPAARARVHGTAGAGLHAACGCAGACTSPGHRGTSPERFRSRRPVAVDLQAAVGVPSGTRNDDAGVALVL